VRHCGNAQEAGQFPKHLAAAPTTYPQIVGGTECGTDCQKKGSLYSAAPQNSSGWL